MKRYLLFFVLLCSTISFGMHDENDTSELSEMDASDSFLFKSALNYFSQQNGDYSVPISEDAVNIPDYVPYQNNNYNNGICYQRIGRFSDEDYFDESCVNDAIASAPQIIKKIIVNLLYPPKNKAALPKRLLLVGKPGTGKTTLAKAIALKCGYDYYLVEAPFLLNEYKNSGPQNLLREIYPLLDQGRKVVVILDELTELTDRYKKENDSDSTVASALWMLLDSCAQCENVFFIGTSNKAKKDLPAQLQSRFDEDIITIDMPHSAARKRMLQHFLKDEKHAIDDSFLNYLIKKTDGRSAREIEKLVCKAIQFANVRIPRRYTITQKDFIKALALWKPFWHPVIVYEKMEPHIQPFFKTAFPIILQTIGLIHSIYASTRQQKNSDEALKYQILGYELQEISSEFQQKVHNDTFKFQQQSQRDNLDNQKNTHQESLDWQKQSHGESIDQQKKFHEDTMDQQKSSHVQSCELQKKSHDDSMRYQKAALILNVASMMSQARNQHSSENTSWD